MGKNKLRVESGERRAQCRRDAGGPKEAGVTLAAEEGASLSSGSLRLYAIPNSSFDTPHSAVGCIDLYAYDPLNRRAAVGIMVATEHRRQGYALAMLQALEQMATANYQLHSLYADIAAPNTASLALFRKAGYTECGHFKEWLEYDSHFIDNIRMQKIVGNGKGKVERKTTNDKKEKE